MARTTHTTPIRLPNDKPKRKPSKYRNVRTEYDGRLYDSKGEANRAMQHDLAQKAGLIRHWEPQPRFRLGNHICTYRADFLVWNLDGSTIVEDFKGTWTADFKKNVKLWKRYGPTELHIIGKKSIEIIRPDWMEGATT